MRLRVTSLLLLLLVIIGGSARAACADDGAQSQSPRRSSGKRIAWIVAGAGAGFAAGVYFGLRAFDDAINSDRKVWLSAIFGAIGGGVAAGLIARDVSPIPAVRPITPGREAQMQSPSLLLRNSSAADASLASRIQGINRERRDE